MPIIDNEYDFIYSSRNVVKNQYLYEGNHFYGQDIWKLAADQLKDKIQNGMTIYGEIVGFCPWGTAIQSGYDYGCKANEFDIYIYRITITNIDGEVFEFSTQQIADWCKLSGIKNVPLIYHGRLKDFIDVGDELIISLKAKLPFDFEDNCWMCKNKVPLEGIVIRREELGIESYKLKSFKFKLHETKMLDEGVEDMES